MVPAPGSAVTRDTPPPQVRGAQKQNGIRSKLRVPCTVPSCLEARSDSRTPSRAEWRPPAPHQCPPFPFPIFKGSGTRTPVTDPLWGSSSFEAASSFDSTKPRTKPGQPCRPRRHHRETEPIQKAGSSTSPGPRVPFTSPPCRSRPGLHGPLHLLSPPSPDPAPSQPPRAPHPLQTAPEPRPPKEASGTARQRRGPAPSAASARECRRTPWWPGPLGSAGQTSAGRQSDAVHLRCGARQSPPTPGRATHRKWAWQAARSSAQPRVPARPAPSRRGLPPRPLFPRLPVRRGRGSVRVRG